MSTALLSSPFYYEDIVEGFMLQSKFQDNQHKSQTPSSTDRRIVGSGSLNISSRNRSLSTTSTGSAFVPVTGRGASQGNFVAGSNMLLSQSDSLGCGITSMAPTREHKKLDRSMSEPIGDRQGNINSSRYKTEMCRPFEESGHCKYGDKCQFAHGIHELRNLARHPKYKTELCRTFHTIGFCPYGPRCHFIHNEDERKLNQMVAAHQAGMPPTTQLGTIERPKPMKLTSSLGSSFDSPPSSSAGSPTNLSPSFSGDIYNGFASSSASSTSSRTNSDSCRSSPVFNYSPVPELLDSNSVHHNVQAPLNINVNNNNTEFSTTMQSQLLGQTNDNQASLFEDNFRELCTAFRDTNVFMAPSSPESISGDSIVSSSSSHGSSNFSAMDLRLPFFNQLGSIRIGGH